MLLPNAPQSGDQERPIDHSLTHNSPDTSAHFAALHMLFAGVFVTHMMRCVVFVSSQRTAILQMIHAKHFQE